MTYNISILIVLILLSAFFSAAEVAFISLSNAKVAAMVKKKLPRSKLIKKLKSNARRLLITILIGNNIVNIASASLATIIASEMFNSAVLGITTGVMTLIILVFGEIVPKSYASSHPKRFAIFASTYIKILQIITLPAIIAFEWLTNLVTGEEQADRVSEEELKALAITGSKQGTIEKGERIMIERLFQFNDITAEDVMTPRVNVVNIEHDMSISDAVDVIEKNPHTRFPIIEETPDVIIGFVHSRDVLLALNSKDKNNSIKKILRPIVAVPKQMRIDDVLREFQKKNTHMGVVLDEYGGTEGILTLEDVIEELVGEIADEHDVDDEVIKRLDKNTIMTSGEVELRDINDFLNCNIPGDPLDTIAEIILDIIQKVPRKGNEVEVNNVKCKVLEVEKRTIKKVQIQKKQ